MQVIIILSFSLNVSSVFSSLFLLVKLNLPLVSPKNYVRYWCLIHQVMLAVVHMHQYLSRASESRFFPFSLPVPSRWPTRKPRGWSRTNVPTVVAVVDRWGVSRCGRRGLTWTARDLHRQWHFCERAIFSFAQVSRVGLNVRETCQRYRRPFAWCGHYFC